MSVYIYFDFEYHRTAVPQVSKSHSCISVKVDLFRCPAGDRKSPSLNILGEEVDSDEKSIPQTAYLSSEVNKYTAELSLGRTSRNTLSRRAHYKRLQKFA